MGSIETPKFEVFSNYHNIIDGELSSTSKTRHGLNPSTGNPLEKVPLSTAEDVDAAVTAAKNAFKTWSQVPYSDRVNAVRAYIDDLKQYTDEFAQLLTKEQGKPIGLAKFELMTAQRWAVAQTSLKWEDEVIQDDEETQIVVRHTPLGVVVGIVPWNFPVYLQMIKMIPPVLTGNTVIIKPSPFTPYCGLKLVELAQQYFPPGVIQVLSGDDDLGPWLTSHPGPDKISFTGSTATGKKVMESAAKTLKRVTLELGGNDPAIICADVDIPKIAEKVALMTFMNSGQICIAIKRIYIHESIFEEFRDALVKATKNFKVGDGMEEGVYIGPLNNSMQHERVKGFIADIEKEKWNVVLGGKSNEDKPGYFVDPVIIDRPAEDSRIVVEEPFGPIVPVLSWKTEDEVIARANDTKMGLGGSVWSRDMEQANRMARRIEAGSVWINTHFSLKDLAPLSGHKESGIGHEFGIYGLRSNCNTQSIIVDKTV